MESERAIIDNYARPNLDETILTALERAGTDPASLTRDDVTAVDEFHIKGREATRELAELAEFSAGSTVLDVGSGVGGPARTLAAEFDCRVTGIDLVDEYCRTATALTERVGLDDRVTFRRANALDLPFDDERFDGVWLQHVAPNVENTSRLFAELHRVLRPGGRLALHEIYAGSGGSPHVPVPWASDPSISHLRPVDELSESLVDAGFEEIVWRDVTDESLAWFRVKVEKMSERPADAPTPVGLTPLMGPDTAEKMRNVVRNLEEERIGVCQAVMAASPRR
ncbi:SAM-dependent methyltransferase [Halovivax gelatinilyticus]|uniref:SAM-dependent methyltransferase n=1 Tax=Halovivax gelatinilyticus TaxID=2961597 RepID=UPI0020CA9B43|nr:class I SAM-dependent methyltransferase [Halovivax gelatinilyticus]